MSTNWEYELKPSTTAGGWEYNEPSYTYNQVLSPESGLSVKYNGEGTAVTWTNELQSD